jgi:hypothetical protein
MLLYNSTLYIYFYVQWKVTNDFGFISALLEVSTISLDEVRIQGVQTKLYLAMDRNGRLYGEVTTV